MKIAPDFKFQNFTPILFIQFAIILPYQLPFPSKNFITHWISQDERYTFSFEDKIIDNEMLSGSYREEEILNLQTARTRVEMNYFSSEKPASVNEGDISDVFDKLLNHLNNIIISYTIKTKDTGVYKITKEMLNLTVLYRCIKNLDFENAEDGLLMLHYQAPYMKDTITMDEFLSIQQYAMFIKGGMNPFVVSEEFMLGAKRRYQDGNYKEAVINAQTSIETFLTALYKQMCKEEGKTEKLVDGQLIYPQYKGITQFVKEKFKKRLGGNWNVRDGSGHIGKWHLNTYKLRNRIVHEGYEPKFQETDEACYSATSMRLYILDLLKRNIQKYPKCNEIISKKHEDY